MTAITVAATNASTSGPRRAISLRRSMVKVSRVSRRQGVGTNATVSGTSQSHNKPEPDPNSQIAGPSGAAATPPPPIHLPQVLGDSQLIQLAIQAGDPDPQVLAPSRPCRSCAAAGCRRCAGARTARSASFRSSPMSSVMPSVAKRQIVLTPISRPSAKITARSITFSSSRTFPASCDSEQRPHRSVGHSRTRSCSSPACTCPGNAAPAAECPPCAGEAAATSIFTTFSRKSRSSRNSPLSHHLF
jgi:hypothetical protein